METNESQDPRLAQAEQRLKDFITKYVSDRPENRLLLSNKSICWATAAASELAQRRARFLEAQDDETLELIATGKLKISAIASDV
jgi:hypothetical protein